MRASVGAKLLAGFGLVIALTALVGVVATFQLGTLSDLTNRMYSNELVGVQQIDQAHVALDSYRLATAQAIVASDQTERERQVSRRRDAEAALGQALQALRGVVYTPEGRSLLNQIETAWGQ